MAKASKKKIVKLEDLGRIHTREHLKRVHPFLRKDFRKLDEKELTSEEVFFELFPSASKDSDETTIKFMLHAVYEFQK